MKRKVTSYSIVFFMLIFAAKLMTGCSKKNTPAGTGPEVKITSPAPFKGSDIPRNLDINTSIKPQPGTRITKVEFYVDGQLLSKGTILKPPYRYLWTATNNFGVLRHIMVKVYQDDGASTTDTVSVKLWDGEERTPMTIPRYAFTSNAVNGIIYVIGGYDTAQRVVEAYDPATDKWTRKASPQVGHAAHASCVINNIIYVFGGDKGFDWIPNVEAYDPAANKWTEKAPIPVDDGVAFGMMGCVAYNGKAYLIGGFGETQQIRVGEYDPVTDKWSLKSFKNVYFPGAALALGQIYVFGGCPVRGMGDCSDASNQLQVYNPTADNFTGKAPMIYGQSAAATAVANNKIYVFGGYAQNNSFMEMYDPAADAWAAMPPMPIGSENFSATEVNGHIYIICSKVYEFFPQ